MIHHLRIDLYVDDNTEIDEDDVGLTDDERDRLVERAEWHASTFGVRLQTSRKRPYYPATTDRVKVEYVGAVER